MNIKLTYIIVCALASINQLEGTNTTSEKVPEHSTSRPKTNAQRMEGKFWQITDIHWDPDYSPIGNKFKQCHLDASQVHFNGYMGNSLCEAPLNLVQSLLQAMKKIEPHPDFILWTGDNAPHSTPTPHITTTLWIIRTLTKEIHHHFGYEIPIIPALGNHDAPQGAFPVSNLTFYKRYLTEGNWKSLMSEEIQYLFSEGGFYSRTLEPGLLVISLNTNLYNNVNKFMRHEKDPAGQFKWLRYKLTIARQSNHKAIIQAHIPPGFPEGYTNFSFMNGNYSDKLVEIMNEFGDVILGQFYGHEHKDSFRVFTGPRGIHRSIGFIAPPVTPMWIAGPTGVNPSVRLYKYNSSGILDYDQYRLNLTEANEKNDVIEPCLLGARSTECGNLMAPFWRLYYRATELYSVDSLTPTNMFKVHKKLEQNRQAFSRYYQINSASFGTIPCNSTCMEIHLCSMTNLKVKDFKECLPGHRSVFQTILSLPTLAQSGHPDQSKIVGAIIILASLAVITLVIAFTVMIYKGTILNPADVFFSNERRETDGQGYTPLLRDSDDFFLADRSRV